jgi:chloramphenicol 3-O phosphotransferase
MSGAIILLNGASSSGKSTLARAIQAKIDAPFWHISIDHLRDAGVLPLARIKRGAFDWKAMRPAFFEGFEASLAAYAAAGNNLIVEYIVETPDGRTRLAQRLAPFDVFCVGVHCDLAELERREAARGDRPAGDARRDFEAIHAFMRYDCAIDTTAPKGDEAERVIAAWQARTAPAVLGRNAAAR